MIIQVLKEAAEEVGINAFITNSTESLETQLRRLTKEEDLPIMLVSWDLDISLEFDQNRFLRNPSVDVTCLLLTKPEEISKDEGEAEAENMSYLFIEFLQALVNKQSPELRTAEAPVTEISMKLAPLYGLSKHSGVLGKFKVLASLTNPCP